MITIHHLGVSQSDRVVWLMEELGLPYELKWYDRGEDFLAPQSYRDLHPAGTAPVITDGEVVLAESAAIVEYISQRHGEGKLSVSVAEDDYPDYLFWMQFNGSFQSALFLTFAVNMAGAGDSSGAGSPLATTAGRRLNGLYNAIEQRLADRDYLCAGRFTCADIMVLFNLTSLQMLGARPLDQLPNCARYVQGITGRDAYQRAMDIAGPQAVRPAAG